MKEKILTNEFKHIGRMSPDTKLTDENLHIQRFDIIINNKPDIPKYAKDIIGSIVKDMDGLYLHGGYVIYKGNLLNLFNPYKAGWFKNSIIWFKMKFSNCNVTFLVYCDDKTILPLGTHNGKEIDYFIDNNEFYPVQIEVAKKTLEHIATKEPLPNPPITYQFI